MKKKKDYLDLLIIGICQDRATKGIISKIKKEYPHPTKVKDISKKHLKQITDLFKKYII